MNRLRRIAVVILTAWMFVVALPASAHGSKGACRPGGFATGVLTSAMERYWRWDLAGEGAQETGSLFLMPLPDGTPISDDPWITEGSKSVTVGVGKSLSWPLDPSSSVSRTTTALPTIQRTTRSISRRVACC